MSSQSEKILLVIHELELDLQITGRSFIFLKHLGFKALPITSGVSFSSEILAASNTETISFEYFPLFAMSLYLSTKDLLGGDR